MKYLSLADKIFNTKFTVATCVAVLTTQLCVAQSGGWDSNSLLGTTGYTDHGNGVIQLLDINANGCVAAAVHETSDTYDPTVDGVFNKCYEVFFGCPGNDQIGSDTKGDGLAFSFWKGTYNINNGLACGGGLGYMGAAPQMITIEFDTWNSQSTDNFDNAYEGTGNEDQIALHRDGIANFNGKIVGVNPGNLEDGLEHTVCINYDPVTDVITVSIDGSNVLVQDLTGTGYELENYFGAGGLNQTWSSGKNGATNPATVTNGADITDNIGVPLCPAEVTITSPTARSIFNSCENLIPITASATAPSGNMVDSVEFFIDGAKVGVDYTLGYGVDWTTVASGTHSITATAYYSPSATSSTSAAVQITVGGHIEATSTAPIIDGNEDAFWSNFVPIPMTQGATIAPDLAAQYRIAYDATNLYLFVDVTDDDVVNDGGNFWDNDGVEVFIDIGNDKTGAYGADDYQYIFVYPNGPITVSEEKHGAIAGVTYNAQLVVGGYTIEASIPWSTIGGAIPAQGDNIGFEIKINDDDAGGGRDHELSWWDGTYGAWNNTSLMGTQVISTCNPITADISAAASEFCTGDSVKISAFPQSDSYLYQWFMDDVSLGAAIVGDSVLWVTSGGNYKVEINNGSVIDTSINVNVVEHILPTANAGANEEFCSGSGGVTLNGSGGGTYLWTPSTGLSSNNIANPIANPTTTTTYSLTVTNSNGCTDTDDITITRNTTPGNPTITLSNATPCIGTTDNFQATGSGVDYFVWALPGDATIITADSDSSDITIDWGTTTTGSISVFAISNSCTSTSTSLSLTFKDVPNATSISGNNNLCDGAANEIYSVSVQPEATYSWTTSFTPSTGSSNSITITDFGSATSGNIDITVTNSCGAVSDSRLISITRFNPLTVSGPSNVVCNSTDNTYRVTGGVGSTYTWSVPSGGTFTAVDPDSVEILVDIATNGGQISVIENNNGCSSGSSGMSISVSGCDLTASFNASGNSICIGEPVTFTDESSSFSGIDTWAWNFGIDATPSVGSTQGPHTVTYSSPGVKDVMLTITEGVAIHDTIIQITVESAPDTPALSGPTGVICENSDIDIVLENSVSGASYQWDISGVLGAAYNDPSQQTGPNNDSININLGTSGGQVTAIQIINGCPSSPGNLNIDVIGLPDAPVIQGPTSDLCGGALSSDIDTFSISPVGLATNYFWSFSGGSETYNTDKTEAYVSFPAAGDYQVSVFALGQCGAGPTSNIFPVSVIETVTPSVSVSASADTVCANGLVTFIATGVHQGLAPSYQWYINGGTVGDTNSASLSLSNFTNGDSIWVVMTSSESCVDINPVTSNDTVFMTVLETPIAEAGPNQYLTDFEETNLASAEYRFYTTSTPPISYLWWSRDSSLTITENTPANLLADVFVTPEEDSTWFYLLLDNGTCQAIDSMYITVDFDIWIPSGFTPNNDGNNDGFQIHNISHFPGNRVEIYNRWGSLVWSKDHYTNQEMWTGEIDGKDLPMATYYYIIQLNDADDRSFAGPVTIVK